MEILFDCPALSEAICLIVLFSSKNSYSLWFNVTVTSMTPDAAVPKFSTSIINVEDTLTIASMTNKEAGRLKPSIGWLDENIL